MKRICFILLIGLSLLTWMACSEDNAVQPAHAEQQIAPGTYLVGINLGVETPLTKGVSDNLTFDNIYKNEVDGVNVIYLHKVVEDGEEAECIEIPVYNYDCQNPEVMDECNGFRFQVVKNDDGTISITAIDQLGNPISTQSMAVSENDEFYFSSIPTRNWVIEESNQSSYDPPTETNIRNNELYKRKKDSNKEIYRSVKTFVGITDLINSAGDLELERKCSGFTFSTLFMDMDQNGIDGSGNTEDFTMLTPQEFETVMGDNPENWYVKVFIGPMFTSNYDMQDESGLQDEGGYYSSSDYNTYNINGVDNGYYTSFRNVRNGNSQIIMTGYGYNSYQNNYLFSPTNSQYSENLILYVYIKHWEGEGSPDSEWLSSDVGAMYTQLMGDQIINTTVQDGIFYECGATIDIRELYAAAVQNGLISSESASTTANSRGIYNGVKEFTLKNAEIYIRY